MEFAVDIVAQRRYLEEDEKFKKLILEEVSGDVDLPKGFNHFVASIVAPGVSGWSSSPGGAFTHWKSAAFARRTPEAVIDSNFPKQTFHLSPMQDEWILAVLSPFS